MVILAVLNVVDVHLGWLWRRTTLWQCYVISCGNTTKCFPLCMWRTGTQFGTSFLLGIAVCMGDHCLPCIIWSEARYRRNCHLNYQWHEGVYHLTLKLEQICCCIARWNIHIHHTHQVDGKSTPNHKYMVKYLLKMTSTCRCIHLAVNLWL